MDLPPELDRKYSIEEQIGAGAFSTVRICRNRISNEVLAVKIINNNILLSLTVGMLKKLSHNNIISYVEHADTSRARFIVMEYVAGTLHNAMMNRQFEEEDPPFVMTGLLNALSYLHDLKIVHREISTNNIFIAFSDDRISTVKLGDFGISEELQDDIQVGVSGTVAFMAPEIKSPFQHDILPVYNFKVDIYSAGIILVCLFIPSTELEEHLMRNEVTSYIIDNPGVQELASKMTEENPIQRLSAGDALRHYWIEMYSTN